MSTWNMRNALVLTFCLTLGNLAATFATLHQVHRLEHVAERITQAVQNQAH